jgi:predicted transcriptional regulator
MSIFGGRRSPIEIIGEALKSIENGSNTRTGIRYRANLNAKQTVKYLGKIKNFDFVEENPDGRFELKERGLLFLKDYKEIKSLLKSKF